MPTRLRCFHKLTIAIILLFRQLQQQNRSPSMPSQPSFPTPRYWNFFIQYKKAEILASGSLPTSSTTLVQLLYNHLLLPEYTYDLPPSRYTYHAKSSAISKSKKGNSYKPLHLHFKSHKKRSLNPDPSQKATFPPHPFPSPAPHIPLSPELETPPPIRSQLFARNVRNSNPAFSTAQTPRMIFQLPTSPSFAFFSRLSLHPLFGA